MAAEKIDALELNIKSKLSVENLDKLIESLRKLGKEVDKVKNKKPKEAVKAVGDGANEAANGLDKFLGKAVRITAVIALFKKAGDVIGDSVAKTLTYNKTLNMFTVSLGEYATNATKYGNTVKDALGIDIAGWQNAQGIFQTLITGFGVSGDQAAYMSQNLTQLSYDIASFYNLTNEEAQNKLKSAISGRLEPIRKLGWDLSQSKLVDIAKNPKYYGEQTYSINEQTGAIEANTVAVDDNTRHKIVNFNQLTQQEKVQLRYIALMTQVTQVQGNYARALSDPANQMKIFKEQTEMTSRALGNIFIPMINAALPYLTAFAQLAEQAFNAIAKWFGYEMPDMSERMNIAPVAEPYNDVVQATGKAAGNAKKLKDYMLGIDELNVLRKPDDNAGGGGGRVGENSNLSNLLTPGYDFLSQAIKNSVEEAKKDLEMLRKDFKAHPLQVSWEIFSEGAGELGSKIWELILGMTPEELESKAQQLGISTEKAFFLGFVRSGTKVALALLGVDEEEAKSEAKRLGISLYEQLWIEAAKKIAINPIFDVVNFAQKAKEAGEFFGRKFTLGYLKVTLKMFSDNPIMKFFYEQVTGSSLEADIRKYQKKLLGESRVNANEEAKKGTSYNEGSAIALPSVTLSNTAADEARKAGERILASYKSAFDEGGDAVQASANAVYNKSLDGVSNNGKGGQMFYNTAANEAYKFAMGISSTKAKNDAYNSGAALSYQGDRGARWWISDWVKAGDSSGQGYVAGVNKNKKSAASSGETIGKAALRRLKEYLGIHSPSTAYGEAGMYSVMGYANYMEKYSYLAENAAKDMAKSSLSAVETVNAYATSNAGYGIGAANQGAMADFVSNIYNAITSAMASGVNGKGGTVVMIDGKEVFRVVKKEERESGIAIGNGAFA